MKINCVWEVILLHGWHKTSAQWRRVIFIARPIASNWSIIILNMGNAHLLFFWAPRAEPTHYKQALTNCHRLFCLCLKNSSPRRHKYISSYTSSSWVEPTRGRGVQNVSHRDLDDGARAQKGVKSEYQYKQECESITEGPLPLDGAGPWNALSKRVSLVFLRQD